MTPETDTGTEAGTSIRATTTVDLAIDDAFALFTEDINTWWNADHHIIEAPLSHMVFDPFVGGNVYDVGTDGSECRWSRVLVYDRPHRVVFSWDISAQWQLEPDPAKCSEVQVTFTEDPPGRTHVVLEHRHLERHGDDLVSQLDGMRTGWQEGLIDIYAAAAAKR
jgi:uncharacterized protein YndB with AHSA1/START domain